MATRPHVSYIFGKLMTNRMQWCGVYGVLESLGGHQEIIKGHYGSLRITEA